MSHSSFSEIQRPGIYVRQSIDNGEGIERQIELCKRLAAERGWQVAEVYIDNDTSAFKPRGKGTAWARMLCDRERGLIDGVIATKVDRLVRGYRDLITIIDAGLWVATADGVWDMSTPLAQLQAGLLAMLAGLEVSNKSQRHISANKFRAENGTSIATQRRFGYLPASRNGDGSYIHRVNTVPDEVEAAAFRQGVDILLGSGSTMAVVKAWNAAGVKTIRGNEWTAGRVRQVLANPAYAGWITKRGANGMVESIGVKDKNSTPLLTQDEHEAIKAIIDPKRTGPKRGKAVKSLLTGIATCGICGGRLIAGGNSRGDLTYRCDTGAHLSRRRWPVDELVTAVVGERLTRPDAVSVFAGKDQSGELEELARKAVSVRERINGLTVMLGKGEIAPENYATAARVAQNELDELIAKQAQISGDNVLVQLLNAEDGAARFAQLDIDRQRAVVSKLFSQIKVKPLKDTVGGRLAPASAYVELVLAS